jgi:hypothetical protein
MMINTVQDLSGERRSFAQPAAASSHIKLMSSSSIPLTSPMTLCSLTSQIRRKPLPPLKAARTFVKPKKTVSFATTATVQERPFSPSDLRQTWYQAHEYGSFEAERRRTILAVREKQGDLSRLDPNVHCVRGLEHQLSSKQVLSRKYKSIQYTKVLLEQQYIQRLTGVSDPEYLQVLSQMFSKQASQRAYLRAVIDQSLN